MPTSLTVMTWNVENLFPPGHAINPQSPANVVTAEEYSAKLDYLAGVIRTINPDVLALQEIGSPTPDNIQSVTDLQARLDGLYPFRALSQYPDARGIRVGFLSRLEIIETADLIEFTPGELSMVANWAGKPSITHLGRGVLRVDVEVGPGIRIRLLTLHLKSKLITYPEGGNRQRFQPRNEDERAIGAGLALLRRSAEAVSVRNYLNTLMQTDDTTHTLVLGDLNDEPRAATSQILLGAADADVTTADHFDYVRLYNLMEPIPGRGAASNDKRFLAEEEAFTRIYMGRGELIDHILASKGLLGATAELRNNNWRLQEVHSLVASIRGESIGDRPAERIGKTRPDHAPVYARFEL